MAPTKKIGFVFIQGMADWEFGFLAVRGQGLVRHAAGRAHARRRAGRLR